MVSAWRLLSESGALGVSLVDVEVVSLAGARQCWGILSDR
jgi:hypothetical protein